MALSIVREVVKWVVIVAAFWWLLLPALTIVLVVWFAASRPRAVLTADAPEPTIAGSIQHPTVASGPALPAGV